MHELFLTASLGDDDRPRALQVLQGYCAMKPIEILRRRMFWTGPLARNNGFDPTFIASQGPRTPFWRLLNEQLVRQAYVVTVLYDVEREQFSKPETLPDERRKMQCDEELGIILWTDLPDPGKRVVNSRLSVIIDGQKNLCGILERSSYRFAREIIEEGYKFVHGNIEICLTRFLEIPAEFQEKEYEGKPKVNPSLPPYENLQPFDSENKWIMTARVHVLSANDQEYVQKGTEELVKVKADFEGVFDLQDRDRHIFDTRVKA